MTIRSEIRSTLLRVAMYLVLLCSSEADVFISEFDASNTGAVTDLDGDRRDWIEIHNAGETTVNLEGWALSNDPEDPGKWRFPHAELEANRRLIVFASSKNRAVAGAQLHTNFRLSSTGSLLLSQPAGNNGWSTVHEILNYPKQRPGVSYGLVSSSPAGELGFFETPTPRRANPSRVVTSFVADTKFDRKRGFYDEPFTVTATSATPGSTLVYTTDGSEPTETNGIRVPPGSATAAGFAQIRISGTTVLRVRATKAGMGSTNIDTQTYIFPAQVLKQSGPPAGLTSLPWSHFGTGDWEMDSNVVNHSDRNVRTVAEDLKSLPTVSVVMDWKELFGGPNAIYPPGPEVLPGPNRRRASLELINPDGNKAHRSEKDGFNADGTVRIVGNTSTQRWLSDKLSFSFAFEKDLTFPIFGPSATRRHDNIILDARFNGVWTYGGKKQPKEQRAQSDYYGDAFVADLHRMAGGAGVHTKVMHLYLNGLYWGIYSVHERPDQHFAAAYLGGEEDEWDVIKHNTALVNIVAGRWIEPTRPLEIGNNTASANYQKLLKLASADLKESSNYQALCEYLDIRDFISYMLVNFYVGNIDWASMNWYATYNRVQPGGKWRFHVWDAEQVMRSETQNILERNDPKGPTGIHQALKRNAEYRLLFADIAHQHLFDGGMLTYPRVWNSFDEKLQTFAEGLRAESARWGDNRRIPPYTRVDWDLKRNWWQSTFFPKRSGMKGRASMLVQLRSDGLYPELGAPVLQKHGGPVHPGFKLKITHENKHGTIYYTTDGTDPRVPIAGITNSQSIACQGPVEIPGLQTIKARVYDGSQWSALSEATFYLDAGTPRMNILALMGLISICVLLIVAVVHLLRLQFQSVSVEGK